MTRLLQGFDHGIHPQGIYIDVIGYVPPDEDFNPEHPTTRSDAMRGQVEMLNWSRHHLGITATEAGSDWVMPYDPDHVWDGSAYFGASLTSLYRLGEEHGYTLICCESRGVNVFFVRTALIGTMFPDHHLGLAHYVPPHYGRGFGHALRFRYRRNGKT